MTSQSLPTRALPLRPDLEQLKRQPKELQDSFVSGDTPAVAEVTTHYHDANPATFALHDAQLLKSTPLGWACRWGQLPLVKLFLDRGADPVEADAEPWATPEAWAKKMKHEAVLAALRAVQN